MSAPPSIPTQDLIVRGEPIQTVFRNYGAGKFLVNRRYQRKLIWTIDEKRKFIDSLISGYPVPIVLLAENRKLRPGTLEIIDGMQRLNAITSFIENDYPVNDGFFDLNTTAETKALLDEGQISQRKPVLDRRSCVAIAEYVLPLSIYDFSAEDTVDEVFRRINSGGRKLSRQELRAAGSIGNFSQVVRKIASKIRGDDSFSDVLSLNEMKKISITNKDLDYGVVVDNIFWVKHNILTKEQIRESRDEELIADIVSYIVSPSPVASRAEFLDDYFSLGENEASISRFSDVDSAVQKRSVDLVVADFQKVFDELLLTLESSGKLFGQLLFDNQPARAPRYFQAVFLAMYSHMITKGRVVKNRPLLIRKMTNQAKQITIAEGGRWGADERSSVIEGVSGVYASSFGKATGSDPAYANWISQLENLLVQSQTEQSNYDMKQGFLKLDGKHAFDEDSFEKICKTCVGIANLARSAVGYILIGIADTKITSERVEHLFSVKNRSYGSFYVSGVGHEGDVLGKNPDQLFQFIVDKFRSSKISESLRRSIVQKIKVINYYEKIIFVIEINGQDNISNHAGIFYSRAGAQLEEIPSTSVADFIKSYLSGA